MLLLLVWSNAPVFAQSNDCGCQYQANKFRAYLHNANGRADSAVFYFKKAFSGGHAALNDLLMATDQAIEIDSLHTARQFMVLAIEQGLSKADYKQFLRRSGRGKVNEDEWIREDTVDQLSDRHRKRLNQALLVRLRKLDQNDQLYRTGDSDSPENDRKRVVQDSINVEDLKKTVKSLGHLPGYNEVGFEGTDILELLFLHMDRKALDWFLPYIIQQIHHCEYFNVEGLAYQIDRIAVSSGSALYINADNQLVGDTEMPEFLNGQYYSVTGYWYDISPFDGVNYFWPVFEPMLKGRLQATRNRLCLDSVEQYHQRNAYIKSVPPSELKKLFGG